LADYFGLFASERANVIRGVDFIRQSPLIGPAIPVHGLMVDVQTGRLEWIVNGYDTLDKPANAQPGLELPALGSTAGASSVGAAFEFGNLKFPEAKIGEFVKGAEKLYTEVKQEMPALGRSAPAPAPVAPPVPPPIPRPHNIPIPPPIRTRRG
jgi:carbonic anhydrase